MLCFMILNPSTIPQVSRKISHCEVVVYNPETEAPSTLRRGRSVSMFETHKDHLPDLPVLEEREMSQILEEREDSNTSFNKG